jgi:hypothetical protein
VLLSRTRRCIVSFPLLSRVQRIGLERRVDRGRDSTTSHSGDDGGTVAPRPENRPGKKTIRPGLMGAGQKCHRP